MRLIQDLIDLVLPQRCAGCARAPGLLCGRCGVPLGCDPGPARPSPAPRGLPPVWTITAYEGPVRAIITAHKESGRTALAGPLGLALSEAVRAALPPPLELEPGAREVVVVPVPSARRAVRRRGHDPMRRMAAVAVREARRRGAPVAGMDALRQRRRVADQAGLAVRARAANLAGALVVRPGAALAGRRVVLADDVITSGATLAEAARALRAAGAEVLAAATVAATPRRRPAG